MKGQQGFDLAGEKLPSGDGVGFIAADPVGEVAQAAAVAAEGLEAGLGWPAADGAGRAVAGWGRGRHGAA